MSTSANNALKTPIFSSLNKFAGKKIADAIQQTGKALPCHVVAITGAIVTVAFDVETDATLPQVTIPVIGAEYIRLPIRIGCLGATVAFDARLGAVSGLGGGIPRMDAPANMTALAFVPIGNNDWFPVFGSTLALYSTDDCIVQITPAGVTVAGDTGNLATAGNLSAGSGWNGAFSDVVGNTYSVVDGIIVGGPG